MDFEKTEDLAADGQAAEKSHAGFPCVHQPVLKLWYIVDH